MVAWFRQGKPQIAFFCGNWRIERFKPFKQLRFGDRANWIAIVRTIETRKLRIGVDFVNCQFAIDDAIVDTSEVYTCDLKNSRKNLMMWILAHIREFIFNHGGADVARTVDVAAFNHPITAIMQVMRQDFSANTIGPIFAVVPILSGLGRKTNGKPPAARLPLRLQCVKRLLVSGHITDQVRLRASAAIFGADKNGKPWWRGPSFNAGCCKRIDASLMERHQHWKPVLNLRREVELARIWRDLF